MKENYLNDLKVLLPWWLRCKESACNAGDPGSIPGWGRSPGEGNGNPLQYACLENSMDGGAWWALVHGVTKSRTRLRDFTHSLTYSYLFPCVFVDFYCFCYELLFSST